MLRWFKGRAAVRDSALQLYGSSVTQARHKAFYSDWSVPDTAECRCEMIMIHLFLLVSRLKSEGEAGQRMSQALLEAFITDMDDNMREMGVGDLTVPKRVKKAAAGAYERIEVYTAAFGTSSDAELRNALAVHLFGKEGSAGNVDAIADYMCRAIDLLAEADSKDLMAGQVTFPVPDAA